MIGGAVAALTIGIFLYWNAPERRIRALFASGQTSIEAEDLEKSMEHVSLNYRDELGLNYLLVMRLLKMSFEEFEGIEIRYRIGEIGFDEDLAIVKAHLSVHADFQGQRVLLTGSQGDERPARITLEKKALWWKVRSVDGLKTRSMGF